MKRRILCFLTVAILFLSLFPQYGFSYNRNGHDSILESVLLGNEYHIKQQPKSIQDTLDAIDCASYLAIDQYNGDGTAELEFLQEYGIHGIPGTIDEIDYKSNKYHRKYTHRGWEHKYDPDIANWKTRKPILLKTINTCFDFGPESNVTAGYSKQCDSFCALVYYIHILGDRVSDKQYYVNTVQMELGGRSDNDDIISEIIRCSDILFQDHSIKYKLYISKLERLNKKIAKLDPGGKGFSQEDFPLYKEYGEDLLDILQEYLPDLLQDESFFASVFFPEKTYKTA